VKGKISFPLPGIEPGVLGCPVRGPVTILTTPRLSLDACGVEEFAYYYCWQTNSGRPSRNKAAQLTRVFTLLTGSLSSKETVGIMKQNILEILKRNHCGVAGGKVLVQ
jgi:hypothetical protein